MTLRETIARHASTVLNRADHFGESVTFVPASGSSVVVRAVVDRQYIEPTESTPRVGRRSAIVFLPTADLPDYPAAGDRLTLSMTLGGSATTVRITTVIDQDEGGVIVEVQS
jgi:hypothetical protein